MWRGEWKNYLPSLGTGNIQYRCTTCGRTPDDEMPFCPFCGAAMTDEAVQMVMKRLEVLKMKLDRLTEIDFENDVTLETIYGYG